MAKNCTIINENNFKKEIKLKLKWEFQFKP